MLLVDVHLVFSDDVVTLLQAVLGITFSYALLDEDTVGGVNVNSLLAVSDDSLFDSVENTIGINGEVGGTCEVDNVLRVDVTGVTIDVSGLFTVGCCC